jgi:hypothetical protein
MVPEWEENGRSSELTLISRQKKAPTECQGPRGNIMNETLI